MVLWSEDAEYWCLHSVAPDYAVVREGRLVLAQRGANVVGGFHDGTLGPFTGLPGPDRVEPVA